jgi:hypothetical protein
MWYHQNKGRGEGKGDGDTVSKKGYCITLIKRGTVNNPQGICITLIRGSALH